MNELKKHSLMLGLMCSLILIKFVIVPVYEWQDDKLAKIQLLAKKKEKIAGALTQETTFSEAAALLAKQVKKANNVFFPYQKEASFKVSQQKLIESLVKKYSITASNVGWQVTTPIPEYNLVSYQLRVQFVGKTLNVIDFITALETYPSTIIINDFYFGVKQQQKKNLGSINGWFILKFYANAKEQILVPEKVS